MFLQFKASPARRSAASLSIVLGVLVASPGYGRTASPFAGFSGDWTGKGSIALTDGSQEGLRCRAAYTVRTEDQALQIRVKCASDSYNFEVTSQVVAASDGTISGTWQEATHQAQGDVTGRIAGPGEIQASLGGTVYGIEFSAHTRGDRQAVAISAQGTGMQSASINLHKL